MTTKITVDAHAGWPVEVKKIDTEDIGSGLAISKENETIIVAPNSIQDFYVWDGRSLTIREMKHEEK